jgi:hypothetical protein
MSVLDLKTDLKSLKYGNDRPGGGDSNQPYQKVDINTVDSGFNKLRLTNFDDGLIRGGAIGTLNASIVDTFRIGKFLTDLPKGSLWITKQVGLQLSNPKLEVRQVASSFGFLGKIINTLNSLLPGPTRIYNKGINTLAQIPVNAIGGHIIRHGLLPTQDDNTKYLAVVQDNNKDGNNRLLKLINELDIPGVTTKFSSKPVNPSIQEKVKIPSLSMNMGGPDSVYGIGPTFIKRYTITSYHPNDNELKGIAKSTTDNLTRINTGGNFDSTIVANATGVSNIDSRLTPFINPIFSTAAKSSIRDNTAIKYSSTHPSSRKYEELIKAINEIPGTNMSGSNDSLYNTIKRNSFENSFKKDKNKFSNPISTPFNTDALSEIAYYNGIKDSKTNTPEKVIIKTGGSWNTVAREKRVGSGRQDEINLTPIFESDGGTGGPYRTIGDKVFIGGSERNINDLVKFRIQSLSTNDSGGILGNWMIFRAYLTQFSDSTDATWNEVKYAGRGDKFYIYDGFSRKIQIGFKVAALSSVEMEPMYQKLNYLIANLMPDYNKNLLMQGPLVRMTVGNWIDGQEGVLNSLSYTIPNDSPWEIAINEINPKSKEKILILPHIVEVSMTFTPIGSQTRGKNLVPSKASNISHIAQNANESTTNQYIPEDGVIFKNFTKDVAKVKENLKPNTKSLSTVSNAENMFPG